jgi:phosphonate transport system substrate-binding protein
MNRRWLALCSSLALVALGAGLLHAQDDAAKKQEAAPLRFSGIPDADKEKLTKQYDAVAKYLTKELGRPVEYVHVPDYTAAVTALAANKLDFVWLGGVTAVQAEEKTLNKVTFVAARDTDLKFKSYFIANRALVEKGLFKAADPREPMPLSALAAMKPAFKELTFTFGAKSSTSGHIMPRHFMESKDVAIDPEVDFKSKAGFQLQGGHSATLSAVATGSFDVGVLNYASWESAKDELKQAAPVIYVTPTYVDYCMVAHNRLGTELIGKLRAAFVKLDPKVEDQKAVLEAFSAKSFVAADPKMWDGIRAVLKANKEKGVLE